MRLKLLSGVGLLAACLLASGCGRRADKAPVAAAPAAVPAGDARAAVLFVEDHHDFCAEHPWTGGPAVYRGMAEDLASQLRARGVKADVVSVPPEGTGSVDLRAYGAAVVDGALDVRMTLLGALSVFVEQGGVLVAVGEAGRFPGEWTGGWPLGRLLGLELAEGVPPDAGVPPTEPGQFLTAQVKEGDPLFAGLTNVMAWGPATVQVLPVRAPQAQVVASFPARGAAGEDLPAVTRRALGSGQAIWLAGQPGGRAFNAWETVPDAVTVVANAIRSAPAREPAGSARPAKLTLAVNRAGCDPAWPVHFAVKAEGGASGLLEASFRVRTPEGSVVVQGRMAALDRPLWGARHAAASLAGLVPGTTYQLEVEAEGAVASSALTVMESGLLRRGLLEKQVGTLLALQEGQSFRRDDAGTPARREELALLLWALIEVAARPGAPEEVAHAVDFTARALWQQRLPPAEAPPYEFALYGAAAAHALVYVREQVSLPLAQELEPLARLAVSRLEQLELVSSSDLGGRMWAAAELYRATGDERYLGLAQADARRLFGRQLEPGRVDGGPVHGDFFADGDRLSFHPPQYERARQPGLYLGFMALRDVLSAGPMKDDVAAVAGRIEQGLLRGLGEATPYGLFAAGLEPVGPLKPKIAGRAGYEPPERFRLVTFAQRGGPVGERGLNAEAAMLAFLCAGAEGSPDLRGLAFRQMDGFLGFNPLGRPQLDEKTGLLMHGPVGRGLSNAPVWAEGGVSGGWSLEGTAWLLALLAHL